MLRKLSAVALACLWINCSLAVGTDELQAGCAADSKACDGVCVPRNDPETGCGSGSCKPCIIAHAVARCDANNACARASCIGDWRDCNNSIADGCEIDTAHDPNNCGACGAAPCMISNGTPGCTNGNCAVARCNAGFSDCDKQASNGCEVDTTSSDAHCGGCGMPCAVGASCQSGVCQ